MWNRGACRCGQVKMRHTGAGWDLNPTAGVLTPRDRRGKFGPRDRHTQDQAASHVRTGAGLEEGPSPRSFSRGVVPPTP